MNLMVTTNQKPMKNTQKIKRKEPKQNTKKIQATKRKKTKRRRKEQRGTTKTPKKQWTKCQ